MSEDGHEQTLVEKRAEPEDEEEGGGFGDHSRAASPHSCSPPSSGDSSPAAADHRGRSPVQPLSCNGIVEVSDKEDADEEEEETPPRITGVFRGLRCAGLGGHAGAAPRAHRVPPTLMSCGHPAPAANRALLKQWASNGRTWCATCNPLTGRNLIRSSEERSGWRQTMTRWVERGVFPAHVLNNNDTYVYSGDNNGKLALPQLDSSQPFLLDLELFVPIVCAEDLCHLPLRALTCFRSFVSCDTRVVDFFKRLHPQSLVHFSVNLIETAIRVIEDPPEQGEVAFRRSKVALQTFYNCAARVPIFRDTIQKHQLAQWISLLRIDFLRNDMILCIFGVIREMHTWFFLSDDLYLRLISDLIIVWSSPALVNENRNYIHQVFITLLDFDPSFLCNCFRVLDRDLFAELLALLDNMLQATTMCRTKEIESGVAGCFLNPNNLYFCLELLEFMDRELHEVKQPGNRYDISVRLSMLVDIIYFCASYRNMYKEVLHDNQKAINCLVGVLKAIVFAQREQRPASITTGVAHRLMQSRNPRQNLIADSSGESEGLEDQENKEEMPKSKKDKEAVENYMNASIRYLLQCKRDREENADANGDKSSEEGNNEEETADPEKLLIEITRGNLDTQESFPSTESIDEPAAKHARIDVKTGELKAPVPMETNRAFAADAVDEEVEEDDDEEEEEEDVDEEEEDEDDEESELNGHVEGIFAQRAETFLNQYLAKTRAESADALPQQQQQQQQQQLPVPNYRVYQMIASRAMPQHMMPSLRQSTLRAITTLCRNSPQNQLAAGRQDVIAMVLQCGLKQDSDRPIMLQLALLCLKAVCSSCPENQQKLLDLVESCGHFIDGPRLIAAMGFKVLTDENGKRHMVPLVELVPQPQAASQPAEPANPASNEQSV